MTFYLAKPVPSLLAHFRFSDCVNMFPPFPSSPINQAPLFFYISSLTGQTEATHQAEEEEEEAAASSTTPLWPSRGV